MSFQFNLNSPARILGLLALMLLGLGSARADLRAKEFYVAFPSSSELLGTDPAAVAWELHIHSSSGEATGSVTGPGLTGASAFTAPAGGVAVVSVPAETIPAGAPSQKAYRVSASADVRVTAVARSNGSAYSFLAWPVDTGGTEHVVLGVADADGSQGSQFLVVGYRDNTLVTLTPGGSDGCPTDPISFTLQTGEVYLHRGCSLPADVSGATVASSAPVGVIAGHDCAFAPTSEFSACDSTAEMVPPVTAWGTQYTVASFLERSGGDTLRIMALNDDTEVTVNGVTTTVAAGGIVEGIYDGITNISSTLPVLVAHIAHGFGFDNTDSIIGDPTLAFPPPDSEGTMLTDIEVFQIGDGAIATPGHVNIVISASDLPSLTVDGVTADPSDFEPSFLGSTTMVGRLTLAIGNHRIAATGPFTATGYAFGEAIGLAFGLDRQALEIAPALDGIFLSPASQTLSIDEMACINAQALLSDGFPAEGISVTFQAAGANTATSTQTTDSAGVVIFCYTGVNAGEDTVTVTAESFTETAFVTWTAPDAPTLTVAASAESVDADQIFMITWDSTGAESCTASGEWSGAKATSGEQFVTAPSAEGLFTYVLTCTGPGGEAMDSVSITVTAMPVVSPELPRPKRGGGGSFNLFSLGLLGLACLLRRRRV